MNWRSHMIVTSLAAAAYLLGANHFFSFAFSLDWFLFIGVAALASLTPDIDLPSSKLNHFLIPIASVAAAGVSIWFFRFTILAAIVAGALLLLLGHVSRAIFGGHRGRTHTFWFGVLLAIPISLWLGIFIGMAALFGVVAHLVEDKIADASGLGE